MDQPTNMHQEEGDEMPFSFIRKKTNPADRDANWKAIQDNISTFPSTKKSLVPVFSIIAVLGLGALIFFNLKSFKNTNQYKTAYAQTKSLTLPDGSKVMLNANSTLKVTAEWNEHDTREVWLEGEAYFEVEKKPATKQKFVVHAKDVDVEVLGTRFNMNTRHEKSTVSLEEGKIRLSAKGVLQSILEKRKNAAVVEMKPGEIVRVDTGSGISLSAEKQVQKNSGWVRNQWHFDSTSLKEIGVMIEDVYGYKTVVTDDDLLNVPISGDLRAADINELLAVLQFTSKLSITKDKKTITISRP